ncbi:DUF5107 domain-containing protein [Confluentibacter flavum]|nr:DUF5107 domain-containing protein [Confluentibacter flavum]
METYMFSDPNPVPDMEKNYPYFKYEGFTNKSSQKEWNMVILENDYIKVFVNTDVGGKIWGAIEKSTGGEFLYYNEVVKFRDVAHRGPWTSGGLEFNYGIMGHTSTCATPQDYVIKNNEDGSVSCIIGAIDLHTQTKWNVEINLQKDKAFVETISSCFNTGNLPVPFYHYSNAAAKVDGDLEFIFPGSHHIGHDRQVGKWPKDDNRDISFYRNNDFGGPKSYHIINSIAEFMGGYYHDDDFGFGNIHEYDKMPGRKLWIWGLSDEGMIWEDLLTDSDGQYIEFQTGSTFNQAMDESTFTPFKHREFTPYDSDISSEIYFPLKKTGGMVKANRNAVLNVNDINDSIIGIRLSALAPLNANLVVRSKNKVIATFTLQLKPLDLFTGKVNVGVDKDFEIEVGNSILLYSSKMEMENYIVDRPVIANEEFNWNSAVGLFTKGLETEKQYAYVKGGYPRKVAQELYMKSLELDPAYAPALNRVAFNHYRAMQYGKALLYIKKSLSINTYDPEANYLFGIVNAKIGELANALSGFYIASQSTSHRSAAYTELAKLYMKQNNLDKAMIEVSKALDYNRSNMVALEIKALIFRLQKKSEEADEILDELYGLDNTNSFVVNEKILIGNSESKDLQTLITNELQAESYIDLALKYYGVGRDKESISVLMASPRDVKVLLLLAFLDVSNRNDWLEMALKTSPYLVFPFRTELYEALTELMELSDDWKLKYYAALILWKKDMTKEAKELVLKCRDLPDYAPFYLAKAKLFSDDSPIIKSSLERARAISPSDWRVQLALVDQLMKEKKYLEASKIAKKNYSANPENSIMGIRYVNVLLKLGKYKETVSFLEGMEIIPFEGAIEGRMIYHEAAIRLSFDALKKGDYVSAIQYVEKAKLWPKKLGSGKPYNVDERLENAILAYCYEKMGKRGLALKYNLKVTDYLLDRNDRENSKLYLQVLALRRTGEVAKSKQLINDAFSKDTENVYIQWVIAMDKGDSSNGTLTKEGMEQIIENPLENQFLLVKDFLDITRIE